jgi:hypothetical protein
VGLSVCSGIEIWCVVIYCNGEFYKYVSSGWVFLPVGVDGVCSGRLVGASGCG